MYIMKLDLEADDTVIETKYKDRSRRCVQPSAYGPGLGTGRTKIVKDKDGHWIAGARL